MDISNRVALVGIGGLFSQSHTLADYWANIAAGRDTSREVPPGRWLLSSEEAFDPRVGQPDKVYCTRGYFIEDFTCTPDGLALAPELLARLDPLYHLALHVGRSAWQDAVTTPLDPRRVGVILGNICLPTNASSRLAEEILGRTITERVTGMSAAVPCLDPWLRYAAGLPALLLAKALGLGGTAFALDAACASSLYAIKLAVDALLSGRVDAMLTGGVSRPDCLYTQMGFSQLRALSPSGQCYPLDARGDGLLVGEGAGIFVLKRLADALAHGDNICATIAGIGLSNDQKGNLLAPDSAGQLRAMRAAYQQAGWQPADVDLLECHATGTPVGDAVELQSLQQLWQGQSRRLPCVLGSVKANIGHTLTAAGAAGLLKIVLALQNETLPPTANYAQPRSEMDRERPQFQVLRQARPWQRQQPETPRRAAISGFGFGGINAHLLLEEWLPRQSSVTVPATLPSASEPLAIVGLDACAGPWTSLDALRQRFFGHPAADQEPTTGADRWWGVEQADWFRQTAGVSMAGHFSDSVSVPVGQLHIPPRDLEEMLPQQLLMIQVALRALQDARWPAEAVERTGVFVGLSLDLNTTNFHLRWWLQQQVKEWNEQLHLQLSPAQQQEWLQRLRQAVGPHLTAGRTLGALGSITASRIARELGIGGPSFVLSSEETSGLSALQVAAQWLRQGELDYALVGAVDLPGDVRVLLARQSDASSDMAKSLLGGGSAAVVLKRLDDARRDGDRIYALLHEITENAATASAADAVSPIILPPAMEDVGHVGAAAGLVDVVKTALALHQRILPPCPEQPAQYWLHDRIQGPRQAAVSDSNPQGNGFRVLLEEAAVGGTFADRQPYGPRGEYLFAVTADDVTGLRQQLTALRQYATVNEQTLDTVADSWYQQSPPLAEHRLACVVIARQRQELLHLLEQQLQRLASNSTAALPSPLAGRCYCTLDTDVSQGKLAFVFPGSGSSFAGMGRDLSLHWPEIFRRQEEENQLLRSQYQPELFWNAPVLAANADHRLLLMGQVAFGTAVSDLLLSFGVQPAAALGYSLGESTALFALRAWPARDEMLQRLRHSPLFHTDLAGRCDAARRVWQLPVNEPVDWLAGVVNCSAEAVRPALADRQRVYLLIINTPGECVIGGQRAAVEAVVRTLKCGFVPLQGAATVHCAIAQAVQEPYRELHRLPAHNVSGVSFYSGGWGKSYAVNSESAAEAITAQALATLDFVRLIQHAYDDGIRTFVEIGPGNSCTRMIEQILADKPHLAQSACVAGQDGVLTVLRLLAQLLAQRQPVNLEPLYKRVARADSSAATRKNDRQLTLSVGQPQLQLPATPAQPDPSAIPMEPAETMSLPDGNGHEPLTTTPALATEIPAAAISADVVTTLLATQTSKGEAHHSFLRFAEHAQQVMVNHLRWHMTLLQAGAELPPSTPLLAPGVEEREALSPSPPTPLPGVPGRGEPDSSPLPRVPAREEPSSAPDFGTPGREEPSSAPDFGTPGREEPSSAPDFGTPGRGELSSSPRLGTPGRGVGGEGQHHPGLDREQCLEIAVGSIAKVLGPEFAEVDTFPTRVRLPAEPLMLVDRIVTIEGQPRSLSAGRIVTEHDVKPGGWYLDNGRLPGCIAIESGQADLFLSGYLGIDFQTRGLAVYRLLDAAVTFHRPLPRPGSIIRYDIHIDRFFRQDHTYLFRFRFEGTVDGEPLLTMRDGCAGFFSAAELAAGKGIVQQRSRDQFLPKDEPLPAPLVPVQRGRYSAAQLAALRCGDLPGCFGPLFAGLALKQPLTLPGGQMQLLDRVVQLDPQGGRCHRGVIRAEQDIDPQAWFLTCHFIDDQVMPGTLMYECCLHSFRVYLLRLGWLGEAQDVHFEPVPGVTSRLKCRGQVIPGTKVAAYEIHIKKIGYRPEPYAIADALMFADGKCIVEITDVSLQLSGSSQQALEQLWRDRPVSQSAASSAPVYRFDRQHVLTFARGKPSEAFGEPYRIFDSGRRLARLPGPPYSFIDTIETTAELWKLVPGGTATAECHIAPDAWYFQAQRQPFMPLAVLLEVALQPCGWLAAYMGSALTSATDLRFRNLGGTATQYRPITPQTGTLTTQAQVTKISTSGGMIIQHYNFAVHDRAGVVCAGRTYFGFFSDQALAQQVGIREAQPHAPTAAERQRGKSFRYPAAAPFPADQLRLIEQIDLCVLDGGPHGRGLIVGSSTVDPAAWYFDAHFYQDPVIPGSLGIESFLQLLKVFAVQRLGGSGRTLFETPSLAVEHEWVYRGQVIPSNQRVTVQADITDINEAERSLRADGWLAVDGLVIYQMKDYGLRLVE